METFADSYDVIIHGHNTANILNSQNSEKLSACANSGYQATLSGGVWPGYEARSYYDVHVCFNQNHTLLLEGLSEMNLNRRIKCLLSSCERTQILRNHYISSIIVGSSTRVCCLHCTLRKQDYLFIAFLTCSIAVSFLLSSIA